MMNIPYAGIFVSSNESIKATIHQKYRPSVLTYLTSGATAGAFAAFLTTPMDLIKTYL